MTWLKKSTYLCVFFNHFVTIVREFCAFCSLYFCQCQPSIQWAAGQMLGGLQTGAAERRRFGVGAVCIRTGGAMELHINIKIHFRGNYRNFLLVGSEMRSWESMEAMVRWQRTTESPTPVPRLKRQTGPIIFGQDSAGLPTRGCSL